MNCCHCGRRIRESHGDTDSGPLGPVCARKAGMPRRVPKMRRDGLPRARTVRIRAGRRGADPLQLVLAGLEWMP